jgi:hypothetical protein
MMWMGLVSAWCALGMAAMFAVNAYFQFATGVRGWIYAGVALLLGLGGFRTLRKMSGGLRLLAGAWGFAAGVQMMPFIVSQPGVYLFDVGGFVLAMIALICLALTVLHQEAKKA